MITEPQLSQAGVPCPICGEVIGRSAVFFDPVRGEWVGAGSSDQLLVSLRPAHRFRRLRDAAMSHAKKRHGGKLGVRDRSLLADRVVASVARRPWEPLASFRCAGCASVVYCEDPLESWVRDAAGALVALCRDCREVLRVLGHVAAADVAAEVARRRAAEGERVQAFLAEAEDGEVDAGTSAPLESASSVPRAGQRSSPAS